MGVYSKGTPERRKPVKLAMLNQELRSFRLFVQAGRYGTVARSDEY